MSRHEPTVRLQHMVDYAREAVALVQGRTRADLDTDRMFGLALLKMVEIIGEAASRLPQDFRVAHPHIPWRSIIATRNRLVHGYDQINYRVLWDIVTSDLPPLIDDLQAIIDGR